MKRGLSCVLLLLLAAPAAAQNRPSVLLIGTYHMANPAADMLNLAADDVLSASRQAEIERVVELLAAYRPTVIALEYPPASDSAMNARYAAYRAGSYSLSASEADQIGLRLAARLDLDRVHGIDYRLDLDVGGVLAFAGANGFGAFAAGVQRDMQQHMAHANRQLATREVAEVLLDYSTGGMDAVQAFYVRAAQVGSAGNHVGADMAATWYTRNLHILTHLYGAVIDPGERVLVLIGAGHVPLLRAFIREAGDWELVDPAQYLRK
jgi:hypothetical protein